MPRRAMHCATPPDNAFRQIGVEPEGISNSAVSNDIVHITRNPLIFVCQNIAVNRSGFRRHRRGEYGRNKRQNGMTVCFDIAPLWITDAHVVLDGGEG